MVGLINKGNILYGDNYEGIKSEKELIRLNKYEIAAIRIKFEQHQGIISTNLSLKEFRTHQEKFAYEISHSI